MPSRSIEGAPAPGRRPAAAGMPVLGAALVSPAIIAGFAVAMAWPWGGLAMVSAGLGAFGAGVAMALRDWPGPGDAAPAVPAATSPGGSGEVAAGQILIDGSLGDLATAAAIARHVQDGLGGRIVAEIRDAGLRRAMRDRFDADGLGPRPILFDAATLLARAVMARERLYDQAYWRDQPRVHAVIVGFGGLGRACLAEAIFAGIAGQLAPPRLTLADADPAAVEGSIRAEMPELHRSADIAVVRHDPVTFTDPEDGALVAADRASPLTIILVCLDDEMDRVRTLGAVARLQSRHGCCLAPVVVLSERPSPATLLARPVGRSRDMARRTVVEGGWLEGPAVLDAIAREDEVARRLHDAYRTAFGSGQASAVPWDALGESYRSASRAAARHIRQKLWTAGLTVPGASPDDGHVEPAAFAGIVEPCATGSGEDALMRRLARLEHDRWCADRRVDGWSYGLVRDDDRRRHPSLVAFDDPRFSDAEIAKDIAQIRFLFRAVAEPHPGGASAPVVIGITSDDGGLSGIPVSGALALIAGEDRRPVILLCTLSESRETAATERLVLALRAAGRAFRLFVPEPRAAARVIHPLCDLAETTIVPLAAGPAGARDGWDDAEADRETDGAVARYLAARCTAIVATAGPGADDAREDGRMPDAAAFRPLASANPAPPETTSPEGAPP